MNKLTFQEYQKAARDTAIYPSFGAGYVYPAIGLANESGEVLGEIKKAIRDNKGVIGPETKEKVKKELGDVLWYIANLGHELGIEMSDVAQANIDKLRSRKERGKLQGSGGDR